MRSYRRLMTAIAVVALASAPAASAQTNLTWSGANPLTQPTSLDWSNAANWLQGVAPSSQIGVIDFGTLGAACNSGSSSEGCYLSEDDVGGLAVGELEIDTDRPYEVLPVNAAVDTVTLDASVDPPLGLVASPSETTSSTVTPDIAVPLVLGTDQAWDVDGGESGGATLGNSLQVQEVSGDHTLDLDLSDGGTLYANTLATGAVTVHGGDLAMQEDSQSSGPVTDAQLPGAGVTIDDGASLFVDSADTASGPVTIEPDQNPQPSLYLGQAATQLGGSLGTDATLDVTGAVSLDPTAFLFFDVDQDGSTPSTDFSQLTATGLVSLNNATVILQQGQYDTQGACTALDPGDSFTIISSSGGLTGELSYISAAKGMYTLSEGQTSAPIPITSDDCPAGTPTTAATLTYNADTITATIVSASGAAPPPANTGSGGGGNSGTGTNPSGTNPHGTGPTNSQITSAITELLPPTGKVAKISRLLATGGYATEFHAPSAGRLTVTWSASVARHRRTIATGTLKAARAGRLKLNVRLTSFGRQLLRRSARLKVRVVTRFTPRGREAVQRVSSFRLT